MEPASAIVRVPFRCPDCGDSVKFESLKDLRHHLQTEHTALIVNNRTISTPFPEGLFSNRAGTPILDMYHADAVRIEDDLLTHKRNELNNKQRRMNSLSPGRIKNISGVYNSRNTGRSLDRRTNQTPASFRQFGHSSRVEQKHLNRPSLDRGVKLNVHGSNPSNNRYLDDAFRDDESLNDVTRPDINVPRNNISTEINRIHNVSSRDPSVKNIRNSNISKAVRIPESLSSDMDNHVRETLTSLSQEVILTRANQHAAVDNLLASQEVYSSLEHSAQEKMCKQQEIIATLALKLSEKDEQLADLVVQVNGLKNQTAEEEVMNLLRMKSNQESEKMLQDELSYKQKELVSLTQRVESVKLAVLKNERERKNKTEDIINLKEKDNIQKPEREINLKPIEDDDSGEDNLQEKEIVSFPVNQARIVERDMLAKEKELVSLRSKSMQLESDRQTLLLEMQALLEIAANDNEKLRAELANQGKQLSKLNLELERSKQEQSELLGETNTLYYQADLSLSRLKHVLEERDSQLSSVSAQLDQAKDMQGRLAKEREEYLKVAVDKEASYQVLVQENALQLKIMKESLAKSQLEKESLQEKLKDMKNELVRKEKEDLQMEGRMKEMEVQLADQEAWQVTMKEQIKNKEERLHSAKKSMDQMNSFMRDTAQKELDARSRLEQFISNLIDRSTQTETELKKLREAYEAKEKAFKDLIETQQAQLSSRDPHSMKDEERIPSNPPSWQKETREDIRNLSSRPSPTEAGRLNTLSNTRLEHPTPSSSSAPRHQHFHNLPSYDDDYDDEYQEPTRLRSTINQVKGYDTVDAATPEKQMKNRPILVLGKEYPHPTAYGKSPSQATRNNTNVDYGYPVEEQENKYRDNRDSDKPQRSSLTSNKYYLPVERDDYTLRQTEPRQEEGINSSPTASYNQSMMNKDTSPHRLNNSLFKNTPEVERMYENVQKNSYSSNPSNLSKKNPICQDQFLPRGQRPHQLPMDDQGIIWGPIDRSGLRARAQKKKVKRKINTKSNRKENLNKNSDSEDVRGSFYPEDDTPASQTKNARSKSSQYPFSQGPVPLGDKIAVLLTSMGPGKVTSNARKDYESLPFATTSMKYSAKDNNLSYSASDSDSQHSSPISNARAVRERVGKLTARHNYRDGAMSPTPKSRTTLDHSIQNNKSANSNKSAIDTPGLNDCTNSSSPNNIGSSKSREEQKLKDAMIRSNHYKSQAAPNDFEAKSAAENRPYFLSTLPEKPIKRYDGDAGQVHEAGSGDVISNQHTRPHIEVMSAGDDGTDEFDPTTTAGDHVDGHEHSLLNPYASDLAEQLESHYAESDFSSSSYATLHPSANQHPEEAVDYTADTQEEEEDKSFHDDKKQNARRIFADVHNEIKRLGTVDASNAEDKDIESEKDEYRRPTVSQVREMFQRSPIVSRESYFSRSSDSNRTSLQRRDSFARSNSYDSVMKELIEKHPYINRGSQEKEEDLGHTAGNVTTDSDLLSHVAEEVTMESESSENILDRNEERQEYRIGRQGANLAQSRVQEFDASENDFLSSDDDDDDIAVISREGSRGNVSRNASRVETMDASTDTDLEKLATPGVGQKSLGGGRKKRKNGSWMKKEKNKRQKAPPKLKDMTRESWTSVDVDDLEEAEREERRLKRRVRVALFCALAYADTKTLLKASQVCRDWRKITQHPALWKHVQLNDSPISSQFLITLSQWCTQTETLSLQGLKGRQQKLMESEDDYYNSIRGSLEPGLERFLFSCQGTLRSLSIQDCENIITDKCMWLVSSNCRMLTHLTYRSRVDPIHPQVMWALGGGCPGITSLYVHPYPDSPNKNTMNNRCLLQIGQFYRDLKEIGLGGMEFNMAGLLPFIQSCQHLTCIHMDSCQPVTDDLATALCRAGIKNLKTFTITNTAFQAKAITTLHANCRQLKRIVATVTPQSCGLDVQKRKEKDEYKKLIKGYKDLKKKAGLYNILTLDILEIE